VQGGLIEAQDYNNLLGGNATSNSNTLDAVWAWGNGSRGYGQTALANVAVSGTVTATNWASLINTLNSANLHINNTSSGSAWIVGDTSTTVSRSFGANVAFESPDRARFFFNSGGRLKFNVSAVNNAGANSRSAAVVALFTNAGGIAIFGANTNGGRTGSGGTLNTNNTARGYYDATIANVTLVSVTSTTTNYTSDTATITYRTNGTQGQHNDNGAILSFWFNVTSTSGANAGSLSFDDSINITPTVTVDVSFPETVNLANTWGAVTVSRQGS